MTTLWINREHMRLRKYGVSGTGTKTIVKIEIEVTDPTELGFLLRELAEIQAAAQPPKTPKRTPQKSVEHRERLALPFYPGSDQ